MWRGRCAPATFTAYVRLDKSLLRYSLPKDSAQWLDGTVKQIVGRAFRFDFSVVKTGGYMLYR